jgi:parallel beta-helix repeat protein
MRLLLLAALLAARAPAAAKPKLEPILVAPGPDAQEKLQEALLTAQDGQAVELSEGVFELTVPLSLDADGVTVRGKGMGKTILSFKGQQTGGEGLLVTSDRVTLQDFTVRDTKGDGVKAKGSKGIAMRRVEATWSGGPKTSNGGYGLYPVGATDVLLDGCRASHASDSGIYVGQSERVIIRGTLAERNVAGIEVENSSDVDVYGNVARGNTGGILIFELPDLPRQGGGRIRLFGNTVIDNDLSNFAPKGGIVSIVPRGTGVLVMGNRAVEVFRNSISGHPTVNMVVASYFSTRREFKDPRYNPYPRQVHIHDNRFGPGGWLPTGELGIGAAALSGLPVPDLLWDGAVDPGAKADAPLSVHDNGSIRFANLDMLVALKGGKPDVRRDLSPHASPLPPLPRAELSWRP